jgi:hypothetical protein
VESAFYPQEGLWLGVCAGIIKEHKSPPWNFTTAFLSQLSPAPSTQPEMTYISYWKVNSAKMQNSSKYPSMTILFFSFLFCVAGCSAAIDAPAIPVDSAWTLMGPDADGSSPLTYLHIESQQEAIRMPAHFSSSPGYPIVIFSPTFVQG